MNICRLDTRKESNRQRILALHKRCLPNDKFYEPNHGYWWISTENGVDCGFAGLVYSSVWSDCGYLIRCGVLPAYRGCGLQKKFIRIRIRQAKALGLNWLITTTYDNPASSNSLISCGFKLFNPSNPWMARGTLYWRLKLEKP